MFLALAHGNRADRGGVHAVESAGESGEVAAGGNERGEPADLRGEVGALGNQAGDKGGFAAGAPELGLLAAEVERGRARERLAGGKVGEFPAGAGGGGGE